MHTRFPHWTGVLWCFPCVPCIHTQCSCAIIQGGSQMAVCSMAGDVKFSHHALNFFSLRTISGGYAFINPHSHIKLVLNALLASSPKKKKKFLFFPFVHGQLQTDCDWGYRWSWLWTDSEPLVSQPDAPVAAAAWGSSVSENLQRVTKYTLSVLLADASDCFQWLKQKQNPPQFSHKSGLKELCTGFLRPAKSWEPTALTGGGWDVLTEADLIQILKDSRASRSPRPMWIQTVFLGTFTNKALYSGTLGCIK